MPIFLNLRALITHRRLYFILFSLVFLVSAMGSLYVLNFYKMTAAEKDLYRESARTYIVSGSVPDAAIRLEGFVADNTGVLQRVYVSVQNGNDTILADMYGEAPQTVKCRYGRYFQSKEEQEILIPAPEEGKTPAHRIGDTYSLAGMDFTVVGVSLHPWYEAPYRALFGGDEIEISEIAIVTEKTMSDVALKRFAASIWEAFGVEPVLPVEKAEADPQVIFDLFLVFCLALLGILNMTFLYLSLLNARRKQQAVFRLLGCGRLQICALYIGELLVLTTGLYVISVALTRFIVFSLLRRLDAYYAWMLDWADYFLLFAVYILLVSALLIVQSLRYMRVSPRAILVNTGSGFLTRLLYRFIKKPLL